MGTRKPGDLSGTCDLTLMMTHMAGLLGLSSALWSGLVVLGSQGTREHPSLPLRRGQTKPTAAGPPRAIRAPPSRPHGDARRLPLCSGGPAAGDPTAVEALRGRGRRGGGFLVYTRTRLRAVFLPAGPGAALSGGPSEGSLLWEETEGCPPEPLPTEAQATRQRRWHLCYKHTNKGPHALDGG